MKKHLIIYVVFVLAWLPLPAQTIYEYSRDDAKVLFFDKGLSQYIPHLIRTYESGKAIHSQIWWNNPSEFNIQNPVIMVTDWEDDGNGGASAIPQNFISVCMAPVNFSYFIGPSNERYHHLFRHEFTHTVMTDKYAPADKFWRTALGGKFSVDPLHPFSAVWSYLGAPRWYAPRWYHEGIACFMETWLGGGVGRALGGYDEMYFRSIVDSGDKLCSVVGLEMEGTTSDFQVGTNSYLYGTRFCNYLEYKYGLDKLLAFYNRTPNSKALFNRQFENVYGESLRNVWNDWRKYEVEHQKEQIRSIEEYPVTETKPLSSKALGSCSPPVVDEEHNCAYMAVNYPGDFAHIEKLDLTTLKRTNLHTVDGPMLYQTCYITLDKARQRLIWTTQNSKYRGLRVYDLAKGKIVKELNYQRVSEVVYDNVRDCLYGLAVSAGKLYLCRYNSNLDDRQLLYSFPFGFSAFDLDVSHDGSMLSLSTSGDNGEQSLIIFNVDDLDQAKFNYRTVCQLEDSNLGLFRFAPGDTTMTGSSYYTGVSNIWSLDNRSGEMSLLSNTRTGLFSPVQLKDGSILALEFERNGMRPVTFEPKVIEDANAVSMLGQKAYEAHPKELEKLGVLIGEEPKIAFGEVYDSIKVYKAKLKFVGAYPEISGFRDKTAWNNVTPVAGYRFAFQDPLGVNSLKFSVGLSPWSGNDAKNQYHAQVEWKYWLWTVKAGWNPTSFYDLAGPLQSSRKGWQVSVGYDYSFSMLAPKSWGYGAQIAAYGMMDALPLHQGVDVEAGINSFQTASAYINWSKTRSTLGSVMRESGIVASADAYTYLAGGQFFPSLNAELDAGFLVPGIRNTCIWIRSCAGRNFGDPTSVFGNEYFGGFGNNWIDYREANRYRSTSSLAGAQIDEISAHSYAKVMAELSLKPIRYSNFGLLNLYPTYTQLNIFGTALGADVFEKQGARMYWNAGAQLNTEMVLFKYLKTTWSIGYARVFLPDGSSRGDWLISLKLL